MSQPSWIGQTLGERYRIDQILGQGGMSAVYKAYDPNLKRVVAIKMIHTHLANDPKFLVRFEEEATAVAQLRHPNIVQVYDFNHDEDLYYMVQEFVPGETLQERLRRLNKASRRMPVTDAIHYTLNICDAAGYAHRRGMIHRDIKPANIMLDIHDQGILMDFGIVKITGGERHTATGAVVGTALYLPPELIRGEVPDPRSDIYSLGVTLFEMISGRPPFDADSAMSLMMMHLNDPLPDMRQLRPEVPEPVIAVVEKSLKKNRDERYSSMDDMANALRSALDALGIGAAVASQDKTPDPLTPLPLVAAGIGIAAEKTMVETAGVESPPAVQTPVPPPPLQDKTALEPPVQAAVVTSTIAEAAVPGSVPGGIPPAAPPGAPAGGVSGSSGGGNPAIPAASQSAAKGGSNKTIWIIAGAAVVVLLVVGVLLISRLGGGAKGEPTLEAGSANPTSAVAIVPTTLQTSTATPPPTQTPTVTPPPPPTLTPTTTLSPTPTIPVGVQYSFINGITIDNLSRYVVDYETFEYTEKLPGEHVHFFFNTVPPEQAGVPGKGPWILYGGPRPFTKYTVQSRPKFATQMCILVANHDHSVHLNSGNCVILPDVPVASPVQQMGCLAGPDPRFPAVTTLAPGQFALVQGISADEGWWNVANPFKTSESCWLPQNQSTFSGDVSTLPMVEAPPLPEGAAAESLSVEILGITIDAQNRYVVDYATHGFSENIPGTHMHFFFNTVPAEQVGAAGGGNRLMHGGPTPFTGYSTTARPADATEICVLVANTDHSVVPDSGNCFKLPDVP